jgi:hypothetical protein
MAERMGKDELAVYEGVVMAACGHPSPPEEVGACLDGLREELHRARASEEDKAIAERDEEIKRLRSENARLSGDWMDAASTSMAIAQPIGIGTPLEYRAPTPGEILLQRYCEAIAKKDAVIKALADALEANGRHNPDLENSAWHTHDCWGNRRASCSKACIATVAALRLAGRLP